MKASVARKVAATKNGVVLFVEELGDKIFIGAATVYIVKGGQINTLNDLKAVAIAGALGGIVWALSAAKNFNSKP
jgi:hypothetical protein